jgi:hypothetical protein
MAVHWNLAAGKTRDAGPRIFEKPGGTSEMAMSDRGRKQLSRRELLASGLVALPVAAGILARTRRWSAPSRRWRKSSCSTRRLPRKIRSARSAFHFVAPDACKMVEGKIDPNGWCSLYAPKPK